MNVKVKTPGKSPVRSYPYLGKSRHDQTVVLFYGPKKGSKLIDGVGFLMSAPCCIDTWIEGEFEPLPPGSVIEITK